MTNQAVLEFRPEESNATPFGSAEFEGGLTIIREIEFDGGRLWAHLTPLQGGADLPRAAIPIVVSQTEDGTFIVDEPVTGVFGHGETASEAFDDFMHALMEYRNLLGKDSPNISERLAGHLKFIEGLLRQ